MKQDQFNDYLKEALKDSEIIHYLKTALKTRKTSGETQLTPDDNDELNRLKARIVLLEKQINSSQESLQIKTEKVEALTSENQSLKRRLDESLLNEQRQKNENSRLSEQLENYMEECDRAVKEAEKYKKTFGEVISVFEEYLTLPEATKRNLSNIINCSDILSFIMTCSEYDNLQRLWDYNKTLAVNGEYSELEALKRVFEFFFDRYNSSRKPAKYVSDTTKPGDILDDDLHIRGHESRVSGRITEVVLRGYKNAITGRTEKKSVVVVRGER